MNVAALSGVSGVTAPSDKEARDHARLVDAAQQFEAMMMQEMLKPLSSSENKWDTGDQDEDKAAQTLTSYGTEVMAKAISKAGGLGIAKKVVQEVTLKHDNRQKKEQVSTKVS